MKYLFLDPRALYIGLRQVFESLGLIDYNSGEVGDVSPENVAIQFSENVSSPTADYLSGVTIKINAVTEAFETATRRVDQRFVDYLNSSDFADANDVVTWEYDDDLGDLEDGDGNPMGDVSAQTVENRVGMHLYWDNNEELIWSTAV